MTMNFEKFERAGEVAVLYSPGYGAGWYTWNSDEPGLLFDKEIVEAVLAENFKKAAQIAEKKYPGGYWGGANDLTVGWVPKGTRFEITEYDGSEGLRILGPDDGLVA